MSINEKLTSSLDAKACNYVVPLPIHELLKKKEGL